MFFQSRYRGFTFHCISDPRSALWVSICTTLIVHNALTLLSLDNPVCLHLILNTTIS